ncbi:hypothetical protein PMAYCL1PPCAC_06095, partial [Pristionchus mayeri]
MLAIWGSFARRVITRSYSMPSHGSGAIRAQAAAAQIKVDGFHHGALGGLPEEQPEMRIARVFQLPREAVMPGWSHTNAWKIDLENSHCWENSTIVLEDCPTNMVRQLKFASKED